MEPSPEIQNQILVVGDNQQDLSAIYQTLSDAGFALVCTSSLDEGFQILDGTAPSLMLILVDQDPEQAFKLLNFLRARASSKELPIIVLTSSSHSYLSTRAFERGANDVFHLPMGDAEFKARLGNQIRTRQYLHELAQKEKDAKFMLELTQSLTSSFDLREILQTVVSRVAEAVRIARISIVHAPEHEKSQTAYIAVASDDENIANLKIDLQKYPEIQQVLRTRQALTIRDTTTHPIFDAVREDVRGIDLTSMYLFPVVWEDQAIGVLSLRARTQLIDLSEREHHLCQVAANATAIALHNARTFQSMKDRSKRLRSERNEAQERLQSLKRYANLFASSANGIAVLDQNGRLVFANPKAFEITGFDSKNAEGMKMKHVMSRENVSKAMEIWEGFKKGEYPTGVDLQIQRPNGEAIICNFSFASLKDDTLLDGKPTVLISFQDVSEHRRTEAELIKTKEFLESLINASVDGIVAADLKGQIILFNKGAESLYGKRVENVIGTMHATELYPEGIAQNIMQKIRSPKYGGVGKLEPIQIEAVHESGEHIPIQLSAALIYDQQGNPAASFGIFTDLREKIQAQRKLAETEKKLQVTERQALVAELAGTAAHELNQPLTSILGYTGMLKKYDLKDERAKKLVQSVSNEIVRMAEIVRKIGKITHYETKPYVGEQKIIDLDRASDPS